MKRLKPFCTLPLHIHPWHSNFYLSVAVHISQACRLLDLSPQIIKFLQRAESKPVEMLLFHALLVFLSQGIISLEMVWKPRKFSLSAGQSTGKHWHRFYSWIWFFPFLLVWANHSDNKPPSSKLPLCGNKGASGFPPHLLPHTSFVGIFIF